jgi:hypothetical protein
MPVDVALVSGVTFSQYVHVLAAAEVNKVRILNRPPLPPASLATQLHAIKAFPTISPVPMAILFVTTVTSPPDHADFDDLRQWLIFVERHDAAERLRAACAALHNVHVRVYGDGEASP